MPCNVVYREDGRGALITCSDVVTAQEIRAIKIDTYSPERIARLRYQIWDFTNATRIDVGFNDLRDFAVTDGDAFKSNPLQIGALVGSDSVFRGLDQLFYVYNTVWSKYQVQTFKTLEAAEKWIKSQMSN